MNRITSASVFVDDQAAALSLYTDVLGFELKTDMPARPFRWLTVVTSSDPDGVELLLEPSEYAAVGPYRTEPPSPQTASPAQASASAMRLLSTSVSPHSG